MFNPTIIIALGFLIAVVLGTILLLLPCATAAGEKTEFIDALFTATSSVCVTGLLTVPNYCHWSLFGQIVVFVLIEIGGLGIITFTTIFMLVLGQRIGLHQRMLIRDAYNLDSSQGLVRMVQRIFTGTIIVQTVGALLYMVVFIPQYGVSGIWKSIFTSVSAFCNAGMDILGPDSLMQYADNVLINIVTIVLILLGGIGFPVWWYFIDIAKERRKEGLALLPPAGRWPLFVKMAIAMTTFLVILGSVVTFVMEYYNPLTIGEMSLGNKILASVFQSVTWRTAGFMTISQAGLNNSTAIFGSVLMFIGGCPSGTAGGIKTTTILIIIATVISILEERNDTELFKRKINENLVRRALAIFIVSLSVLLVSMFLLCAYQPGRFIDIFYEVISALGTVGLSRDLTPLLNTAGKLIIIVTMYLGRIGPISLSLFFNTGNYVNKITYVEENVSVG